MRTYSIGLDEETKHDTLSIHLDLKEIPFNVWRNVSRFAFESYHTFSVDDESTAEVFKFNIVENRDRAELVLQGALFTKVE